MLYLKKVGDNVRGYNNPDVNSVTAELSREVIKKVSKPKKLDIFCEDIVAGNIIKILLADYKNNCKLSTCSLGAEEYLELIRVELKQIVDSVIILDGDKNCDKVNNKFKKI